MCIVISNVKDEVIKKEYLETAAEKNPDGYGLTFIKEEKIIFYKTMEAEAFINYYLNAKENNMQSPFILHFRIATQGEKNIENCHPFQINENLVFAHNGIINNFSGKYWKEKHPEKSDTMLFNDNILQKLPDSFYKIDAYKELIEDYIGYSKLVFLDNKGELVIYNKEKGEIDEAGNWYSNGTYKPIKIYKSEYQTSLKEYKGDRTFSTSFKVCPHCFNKLITQYERHKNQCLDCIRKQNPRLRTCPIHSAIQLSYREEKTQGKCFTCIIKEDEEIEKELMEIKKELNEEESKKGTFCKCSQPLWYPEEKLSGICYNCNTEEVMYN